MTPKIQFSHWLEVWPLQQLQAPLWWHTANYTLHLHIGKVMRICERELNLLDMVINARKSCCVRIGPRNSSCCWSINIANGPVIPCTDKIFGCLYYALQNRLGSLFNISATAEASEFKFGMQLEFATHHRKKVKKRKSGRASGLGELFQFGGYPLIFLRRLKIATSKLAGWWGLPKPIIKSQPEEKKGVALR